MPLHSVPNDPIASRKMAFSAACCPVGMTARPVPSHPALPLSLAGSFTPDLGGDHRYAADDLRLRCKPVWMVCRP